MLTAQDAARHLLKLKKAEDSFEGFHQTSQPEVEATRLSQATYRCIRQFREGHRSP